ncbi:MAG: monofunctional biosynthetic peptidoglycan transglycosylase [Bacteroidota bacterium]
MKIFWPLLKKIFIVVFIIHVCWFLFFVFSNFSDAIEIKEFKQKLLIFIGLAIILAIIYFIWLRKIDPLKKLITFCCKLILTGYIIYFFYFLLGFIFNPVITITQAASVLQGNGLSRDYIGYDEMGPNIKLAVIASEDQKYPDHDGFDLKAIKLAMKYNKKHPGKTRGGSTISQQTAKNVFLFQGGGFIRKGPEVFFTFTIETGWTKKIILERYLNIAEMGRGVFGVQAAAKKYFNKDAINLTRAEAAQIAACLPNPKVYTVKPLSKYVANRYDDIMRQMNNLEGDADVQEIIK